MSIHFFVGFLMMLYQRCSLFKVGERSEERMIMQSDMVRIGKKAVMAHLKKFARS